MNNLKLTILLVTLFAICHSCQSYQHVSEQCSPKFSYVDETKKQIDVDSSVCFCRQYKFSQDFLGSIQNTSVDKPLSYCDRIIGFKDYAKTQSFWESVRLEINDSLGKMFED